MQLDAAENSEEEEKKGESVTRPKRSELRRPEFDVDVASLPTISMDDVPNHKTKSDCWTVVDGLVYDVTQYIPMHPGGKKIMLGAGREASATFRKFGP